jgi:hypothetical protein
MQFGGFPKVLKSTVVLVTAYQPDDNQWDDEFLARKK